MGDGTLGVDWDKIETDPDGSSVGFSDPGLSNPTESNDLFTSGWSFGTFSTGQSYIYSVDGIHVPPEFFWGRIDNGAGDLALNLLFFSATQSLRIREWRFIGVDGFDQTFAVGQVSQRAVDLLNQGSANAFATLDDSWSLINLISVQPQLPTDVGDPLTEKQKKELDKNINKVKGKINKTNKKGKRSKCREFLESHGISIANLERVLDTHERYYGPGSTNTVEESGLEGPNARQRAEGLEGQARTAQLGLLDRTVKEWFQFNPNVQAAVATGAGNPATVYYRTFGTQQVLHESLHIATGLNDINLANKLGLTYNGTRDGASMAIDRALKDNGCL